MNALKGQQIIAQGIALGINGCPIPALKGQKRYSRAMPCDASYILPSYLLSLKSDEKKRAGIEPTYFRRNWVSFLNNSFRYTVKSVIVTASHFLTLIGLVGLIFTDLFRRLRRL